MTAYGDKGRFGATEVHTIRKDIPPRAIEKAAWDQMRIGMVCFAASNAATLLSTIDKLCASSKRCKYDDVRALKAAIARVTYQAAGIRFSDFYYTDFGAGRVDADPLP